ncbi:MAG: chalcone isomerase family protein [Thiohalomonadales bacterium]
MTNIQQNLLKFVALFLLLSCSSLAAKEISGVTIPEKATLSDSTRLQLNGAGIRSKFFFDIYIGALYVETTSNSAKTLISSIAANRMLMHFLYDGVSKKKITGGWTDGFEENNSPQQFEKLKAALNQFNDLFTDTKKGDVILLDYLPQTGTQVSINNELKGTIPGEEFNKALRKVWLGDEPADSGLKKALLGG